jgi:hypothetical protein
MHYTLQIAIGIGIAIAIDRGIRVRDTIPIAIPIPVPITIPIPIETFLAIPFLLSVNNIHSRVLRLAPPLQGFFSVD